MGHILPAWRPGLKVRETAQPKFYWFDPGVARAAAGLLADPADRFWKGTALETLISMNFVFITRSAANTGRSLITGPWPYLFDGVHVMPVSDFIRALFSGDIFKPGKTSVPGTDVQAVTVLRTGFKILQGRFEKCCRIKSNHV